MNAWDLHRVTLISAARYQIQVFLRFDANCAGPSKMTELYNFDPPNEDFNHSDSYTLLDSIRFSSGNHSGKPINADVFWTASPGDSLRPDAWDAVLLSSLLLQDPDIHRELGNLSRDGWPTIGLNPLKSVVLRCIRTLPAAMEKQENDAAEKFFTENPWYGGVFRTWENRESYIIDDVRFKLADKDRTRIIISLERAMPMILKWCCCTFCYCRDMWAMNLKAEPLDFSNIEADENTLVESLGGTQYRKPKRQMSVKEKYEEWLASLTPEEQAAERRRVVNQKIIQSLKRKGKIDDQTLIDLEH